MKLFGLVDLISDFFFGPPLSSGYGKPGSGFTPAPLKGVIMQRCPVCHEIVIYFEREQRLCVHGPGPNEENCSKTVCPGSGANPRWKSMKS